MARTLRQLAGLRTPERIDPAKTALILIDIQHDYFAPDKLFIPEGQRVLESAGRLRRWAREKGVAVIHIQQISPVSAPIFAAGSEGGKIQAELAPQEGEPVIEKTLPSSFDRTTLHDLLQSRGISVLILAGLMTHMCVETTARGALPLGYAVIVVADACASRDLPSFDGQVISHQEVHRNALAAMADRFADVMLTDDVVKLA